MDWKFFWITFGTIFMAELGDKTQIGIFSFSASKASPLLVFSAASLGLIASTLMAVLAGNLFGKVISPKALRILGGTLFILVGIWTLMKGDS